MQISLIRSQLRILTSDHYNLNKQVSPDRRLGLNQLRGFHTDVEFLSKEGASKIKLSSHFGNTIS